MTSLAWSFFAAAILLLPACGSAVDPPEETGGAGGASSGAGGAPEGGAGGASSSSAGGAPPDQATLCRALRDKDCEKLAACSAWALLAVHGDVAGCKARLAELCDEMVAAPGFTPRDAASVAACTDDLENLDCHEWSANRGAACAPVAGTLPDGSACAFDEQCVSTYCQGAAGNACGACAPRLPAGADCGADFDGCAWGNTCIVASGSATCGQLGVLGDACDDAAKPCSYTLGCVAGACTEMSAGDACVNYDDCGQLAGLICDGGACAPIQVGATGAGCGTPPIEYCEGNGVCVEGVCAAAASDGDACESDGFRGCVAPAECVDGVCAFPSASLCR